MDCGIADLPDISYSFSQWAVLFRLHLVLDGE